MEITFSIQDVLGVAKLIERVTKTALTEIQADADDIVTNMVYLKPSMDESRECLVVCKNSMGIEYSTKIMYGECTAKEGEKFIALHNKHLLSIPSGHGVVVIATAGKRIKFACGGTTWSVIAPDTSDGSLKIKPPKKLLEIDGEILVSGVSSSLVSMTYASADMAAGKTCEVCAHDVPGGIEFESTDSRHGVSVVIEASECGEFNSIIPGFACHHILHLSKLIGPVNLSITEKRIYLDTGNYVFSHPGIQIHGTTKPGIVRSTSKLLDEASKWKRLFSFEVKSDILADEIVRVASISDSLRSRGDAEVPCLLFTEADTNKKTAKKNWHLRVKVEDKVNHSMISSPVDTESISVDDADEAASGVFISRVMVVEVLSAAKKFIAPDAKVFIEVFSRIEGSSKIVRVSASNFIGIAACIEK